MPADATRPLLKLNPPSAGARVRGGPKAIPGPSKFPRSRQKQRFDPVFDRLRRALENPSGSIVATRDPTALAPESLLVFEVTGALSNLATALRNIPGLQLIAEDISAAAEEGEEDAFVYMMIPDRAALERLLALWARWRTGRDLDQGFAGIRDLFACLRDVRRWSPQDRVVEVDAATLSHLARQNPAALIAVEIELVFRASPTLAEQAEEAVRAAIAERGGTVIDAARHPEFASHAMLARLPASEVAAIAARDGSTLAGLEPVLSIGPQSRVSEDAPIAEGAPVQVVAAAPERDPIVGIFDAVPDAEHPFLAGRLLVDDPDDLAARSVGVRSHGTAVASLVLHGDLNAPGPALRRPVYLRPVMFAPDRNGTREVFTPDRLVVDSFYEAVVRMKGAGAQDTGTAPTVVVVNVSLGDSRRRFGGRLSRWARALDHLAWRYGILFVVSAGNLDAPVLDDVPLSGFSDLTDFSGATDERRSSAVLAGLAASIRHRALLAPADSVNALTVGAAHKDTIDRSALAASESFAPFPGIGTMANLSSAPGPGFGQSVKPDVILPGGRERILPVRTRGGLSVRSAPPGPEAGLRAAAPGRSTAGLVGPTAHVGQTSAAAAIATRTLHRVHDALESAYGRDFTNLDGHLRALVLKALLVHRARWTDVEAAVNAAFGAGKDWRRHRSSMSRLLGYGLVDPEEVVYCASNRATAWGVGRLAVEGSATFRLPLPPSLSRQLVDHGVSATLAWFTPPSHGRRNYRQVRLTLAEPEGPVLGKLGLDKAKSQPEVNASKRGTVAHRVFAGAKAAALVTGDALELRVQREPDVGIDPVGPVPFALAVSVEATADLPIYDEVLLGLNVQPAVRVPVDTVVLDAG